MNPPRSGAAVNTLTVMLVQAQLLWKDPAHNREHLEKLLTSADADCHLAVLPETFTTGSSESSPKLPVWRTTTSVRCFSSMMFRNSFTVSRAPAAMPGVPIPTTI